MVRKHAHDGTTGHRHRVWPVCLVSLLVAVGAGMPPVAIAAAPALHAQAGPLSVGRMELVTSQSPLLIAAPHDGFDLGTGDLAYRVAEALRANLLIASGYRTREHPWNVNRPTEGIGLRVDHEPATPAAGTVYAAYAARVTRVAPALYVEIRGEGRGEDRMEIATQRISPEEAAWLKRALYQQLATLPPEMPHLEVAIEPLDPIYFGAHGVKERGVFRLVGKALHIELPARVRRDPPVRAAYAPRLAAALRSVAARL